MTASAGNKRMMKIGISGGGPAGLTLAAILDLEGNGADAANSLFDITVFERGKLNSDQGSGWDMNQDSQDALKRAGIDPTTIQRPGSDSMRFYKIVPGEMDRPMYVMQMPTILEKLGLKKEHVGLDEINYETERNKLINNLLTNLEHNENVRIKHECYVAGANRIIEDDENSSSIELISRDGSSLGKYDLVIDASGVNSPLRHLRFSKRADAFYTGTTYVQYTVKSPENSWDKDIVGRLGEGTLAMYGPTSDGKGTLQLAVQRYGANIKHQVVNISLMIQTDDPNQVPKDLDVVGLHGYLHEKDIVQRVVDDAKSRLFHKDWPQSYRDMFDSVEGVRILPIYMHPMKETVMKEVVPGSDDLPFIGIGDSLHALPPWSGMSGNYALMDAADLATALLTEQQDKKSTSASLVTMLRENEQKFMERTEGRRERTIKKGKHMKENMPKTKTQDFDFVSNQVLSRPFSWKDPEAVCVAGYLRTLTLLNRYDNYRVPTTATR